MNLLDLLLVGLLVAGVVGGYRLGFVTRVTSWIGLVAGLVLAIAPDRPGVAYALTVDELEAVLAGDLSSAVSTGPCI